MPRLLALAGALLLILALLPFTGTTAKPADQPAPAQPDPTRGVAPAHGEPGAAAATATDEGGATRTNAAVDQGIAGRIVDCAQRPVGGAYVAAVLRPAVDPL